MSEPVRIEYMCTRCGLKTTQGPFEGRPAPGRCPRTSSGSGAHSWVINRKYYKPSEQPKRNYKRVEFMCRHCGAKSAKWYDEGRPDPGRCPRRTNEQPHAWVVNRKY